MNRADPAGTMDTALPVWRFVLPKVGLSFGPIGAVVVGGVTLITAILTALGALTDYPDYALPIPAPAPAIPTPRSKEATEEKVITADPPSLSTVIYRYGGTNSGNLTPKEKNLRDGRGLSFSTVPIPGCSITTIEAINATGFVYAVKDGPIHVSVYPVGGTMSDWVSAGSSSVWTQAVKSVVIKWGGVS